MKKNTERKIAIILCACVIGLLAIAIIPKNVVRISNAVVNENNNIRELMAKEKAEIERILFNLTAMAVEKFHELFVNQRTICQIDFLVAKAKLALKMNAITPKINNKNYVVIEKETICLSWNELYDLDVQGSKFGDIINLIDILWTNFEI